MALIFRARVFQFALTVPLFYKNKKGRQCNDRPYFITKSKIYVLLKSMLRDKNDYESIIAYAQDKSRTLQELCFICFESSALLTLKDCDHKFCSTCLGQHCTIAIQDDLSSRIRCPEPDCDVLVCALDVHTVVTADIYDKFDSRLLDQAILGIGIVP